MRYPLLLTLIFLGVVLQVQAQRFNGGLILGGVVSQVDGDGYGGFTKFGFLGGGLVSLKVSPHSSFQAEMEYFHKGSRVNADSATNSSDTYLMRFHYLEIPILYQYTFGRRLSAEVGPVMDVSLGSYEESNGLETQSTVELRPLTLAGILGVSGMITPHLKLNLRVNYSIMSIRKTSDNYPSTYRYILWQKGQFNNVLSLSILWYFKPFEGL